MPPEAVSCNVHNRETDLCRDGIRYRSPDDDLFANTFTL